MSLDGYEDSNPFLSRAWECPAQDETISAVSETRTHGFLCSHPLYHCVDHEGVAPSQ